MSISWFIIHDNHTAQSDIEHLKSSACMLQPYRVFSASLANNQF